MKLFKAILLSTCLMTFKTVSGSERIIDATNLTKGEDPQPSVACNMEQIRNKLNHLNDFSHTMNEARKANKLLHLTIIDEINKAINEFLVNSDLNDSVLIDMVTRSKSRRDKSRSGINSLELVDETQGQFVEFSSLINYFVTADNEYAMALDTQGIKNLEAQEEYERLKFYNDTWLSLKDVYALQVSSLQNLKATFKETSSSYRQRLNELHTVIEILEKVNLEGKEFTAGVTNTLTSIAEHEE